MICQYSNRTRCWIAKDDVRNKVCPMLSEFMEVLKKCVLLHRELKSTDIKKFLESVPGTSNPGDLYLVSKANVSICFDKWLEICELIGVSHNKDISLMNNDLCRDMIKGQIIFLSRSNGFIRKQAERFAERKIGQIWASNLQMVGTTQPINKTEEIKVEKK